MSSLREIKILQEFQHPNIIELYDVFYASKTIYLVMEFMEHDLSKIVRNNSILLEDKHIKTLLIQTLEGLQFLH